MTYHLYLSPGTASLAVHWALIEIGVPFEVTRLDFDTDDQHDPDYLKLNPLGRVPTLIIDGQAYSESAALVMLLAERHPTGGLAPAVGAPERARWLETMIFLANTVLPAMRDWFYADKDGAPAGPAAEAVRDLARVRIEAAWRRLDADLADGRTYLFGEAPGVADFLAIMVMRWSRNMPAPATRQPHLAAYVARMTALPSFAELSRREGLTPWP